MTEKKEIGQSTKSIWSGEQEHELYERSTHLENRTQTYKVLCGREYRT
jgi:hypothetical protein